MTQLHIADDRDTSWHVDGWLALCGERVDPAFVIGNPDGIGPPVCGACLDIWDKLSDEKEPHSTVYFPVGTNPTTICKMNFVVINDCCVVLPTNKGDEADGN